MVGQKDPKVTSPKGHTKITTIYRTTLNQEGQNMSEKLFYN